jgi:hypothetical protein
MPDQVRHDDFETLYEALKIYHLQRIGKYNILMVRHKTGQFSVLLILWIPGQARNDRRHKAFVVMYKRIENF